MDRVPASPKDTQEKENLVWALGERVKELTALHGVARLLQDGNKAPASILAETCALLPSAWQYPEITAARISIGDIEVATPHFRLTNWRQSASFAAGGAAQGQIDVVYLGEKPESYEGPFLWEERALIQSVAQMLATYFERRAAEEKVREAYVHLERQVRERTADLERANQALRDENAERRRAEEEIQRSQARLRRLTSELALAGERERRAIASDLHDHIGQALTIVRSRLGEMRGNAVFSGMEQGLEEALTLLDQTIQSTRTLTFEISPPVLYDLGLEAALQWLCQQFRKKHHLPASMTSKESGPPLPLDVQITVFRCVQELLLNAAKHAHASSVNVHLARRNGMLRVEVRDDGRGFDVSGEEASAVDGEKFGLTSVRERLKAQGGAMEIRSSPGCGASVVLLAPLAESVPPKGGS
jgi:signal transduction histidine kinase